MNKRILIIEDDINILQLEADYLEANKFTVESSTNGKDGLDLALKNNYDLILLDIMLPEIDGLEICRLIRKEKDMPILLVSAKRDDFDKIKGLGLGADDYIVKPFSPSELVARVIAHIKRYERLTSGFKPQDSDVIDIDNIKIDKTAQRVFMNEQEIVFTNKEFELFTCLAENPDTLFSKEELFKRIWQCDSIGETSTIIVHINRIRDKLFAIDKDCPYVNTVWGRGYRFNK